MTNQTIDGVRREDFTDIASAARCMTATTGTEGWGNAVKCFSMLCTPYAVIRMTNEIERLRALLDKEVSGDSRAPLPHGEPVALPKVLPLDDPRCPRHHLIADGFRSGADWMRREVEKLGPLYAEQPAPVAVVMPERKVVSGLVKKAARQADLTSGANYYTAAELAAEAVIDEVTRLNTKE